MGVTLRQLEVLVSVLDRGGFGAAAEELGMGQSSVSHSLATLERAVEGELVVRDSPARPTSLGQNLLPHARAILAAVRGLDAAVAVHQGNASRAPIGLGVPPTAARGLLPELLLLWRAHAPQIQVRLFEGFDEEIEAWLDEGVVDAGILIDPEAVPDEAVIVARDSFQAVVRSDHPLATAASIELSELLHDPLLASAAGCETQLQRMHDLAGLPFQPAQRIRELGTLLGMVEAGLGVAAVPSLAASMLGETLTLVALEPRIERRLVLTGPVGRPWHPLVTELCEITRNNLVRLPTP
ncbi:LysR family transcriptional regulator [Rhodococcus koreensis]